MIQISVATPPILWIPIRPSLEALGRVMEEFLTAESVSASRHLTDFEDSLKAIGFDSEKLAKGELTGKSDINPSLDPHSQESYKHEKLDALTFLANLKIDEDNDHTAYKPRRANKRKKYRKVAYGIKQW